MRLTVDIDSETFKSLEKAAHRLGRSVDEVAKEVLRAGVPTVRSVVPSQMTLPVCSHGLQPRENIDVSNTAALLDYLDEADGDSRR